MLSCVMHTLNLCKILSINCPLSDCQRVCPCLHMPHICPMHMGWGVVRIEARMLLCAMHTLNLCTWGEVRVLLCAMHTSNLRKIVSINCPSADCQRVCPCVPMPHICPLHMRVGWGRVGGRLLLCAMHTLNLCPCVPVPHICPLRNVFLSRGDTDRNEVQAIPGVDHAWHSAAV